MFLFYKVLVHVRHSECIHHHGHRLFFCISVYRNCSHITYYIQFLRFSFKMQMHMKPLEGNNEYQFQSSLKSFENSILQHQHGFTGDTIPWVRYCKVHTEGYNVDAVPFFHFTWFKLPCFSKWLIYTGETIRKVTFLHFNKQ